MNWELICPLCYHRSIYHSVSFRSTLFNFPHTFYFFVFPYTPRLWLQFTSASQTVITT